MSMLPRLHVVYGSVKLYLHTWNFRVLIPVQLCVEGQESDHR